MTTQDVPELDLPSQFRFGPAPITPATPSLGPLTAFTGTFAGNGFNTIFRPNIGSPTVLPTTPPPGFINDNVLELNLTSDSITFSKALGSVPNRGEVQPDIFLNGVPYLQVVEDVTTGSPVGIHVEPGLWMSVQSTTDPAEPPTVVRMGSIPHGTTINAQGTHQTFSGPPSAGSPVPISPVDITPLLGAAPVNFPSQTAALTDTYRIPQDLSTVLIPELAGSGVPLLQQWQNLLDNPNFLLTTAIAGQNITSTTAITISTDPQPPLAGGGTDNIAFLQGAGGGAPNAQTTQMSATFWIETVEHVIVIPPLLPGQPVEIPASLGDGTRPVPTFLVDPPIPVLEPREIVVTSTQIQYSQLVILNFNGLLWPHVSLATLVPSTSITIPPHAWLAIREDR